MSKDFLVEIGTEELPPKSLKHLMTAFALGLESQLREANLEHSAIKPYATPRRLAVLVSSLAQQQPEQFSEKLGPAVAAAYDANGKPTKAAEGFARSCGVSIEELEQAESDKGPRLAFRKRAAGKASVELLPAMVEQALATLPIDKRMRWGASRAEFVRPVHWVMMIYGDTVVEGNILGITAGQYSRGHRFHHPDAVLIGRASAYAEILHQHRVIADFAERRELIRNRIETTASDLNAQAIIDEDLLDEVTALNEWPVVLAGNFDSDFLKVPAPALISSMKEHQKYFHLVDTNGALLPAFITVANIDSYQPEKIIAGNERVIRPRLADAAFFYKTDLKVTLQERREQLRNIVFQKKLGSVFDKTERVAKLAAYLAHYLEADTKLCEQAAQLSKSDLVSEMVLEFPDLQGTMGEHYARAEQLEASVCQALLEQYQPRFSGDALPTSKTGITLALADRLDTLVGIFAIGQIPSGSSDPFALRRASLAILRILVENKLDLDLADVIDQAASGYSVVAISEEIRKQVFTYINERFYAWFEDQGVAVSAVQAVMAKNLTNPVDIVERIEAVASFMTRAEAPTLAAANKRVANLLSKQEGSNTAHVVDSTLFNAPEETQLHEQINTLSSRFHGLVKDRNYGEALALLAGLKEPVDAFFDNVMVMVEDGAVRDNRLALLAQLRGLFLEVADVSLITTVG